MKKDDVGKFENNSSYTKMLPPKMFSFTILTVYLEGAYHKKEVRELNYFLFFIYPEALPQPSSWHVPLRIIQRG